MPDAVNRRDVPTLVLLVPEGLRLLSAGCTEGLLQVQRLREGRIKIGAFR